MAFKTPGTFNSFTPGFPFQMASLLLIRITERKPWGSTVITTNLGSPPKLQPPLINWLLISPSIPFLHQGEGILKRLFLLCHFWLKRLFVAPPVSTLTVYFLLTLACPCPFFICKLFCKAVSGSQQSQTVHRDFPCISSPNTDSLPQDQRC